MHTTETITVGVIEYQAVAWSHAIPQQSFTFAPYKETPWLLDSGGGKAFSHGRGMPIPQMI